MRLIDADALKARLDFCTTKGMGGTIAFTFKHMVDEQPTIQPEPKMGRWIYKNDLITVPGGYWECSECKEGRLLYEANFCPNCGADMRTAEQIVHDAIDNTPMAEDAYPGIKERLHKAVDDMREVTT